MTKINLCICTYKRPGLLTDCLQSIGDIIIPSGTEVTVTVIDNDQARSAEALVIELTRTFLFKLYYHCESRRGIPYARNRAVEETHHLGSDYLVFIDDDEWVEPLWLDLLYCYCQKQGGNIVVSGAVISDFPDGTPDHISYFLSRKQKATGTLLGSCATNNVLVPIYLTKDLGLRFDETNPLAGGTDTIFFCEAVNIGVIIKKCAEALVHESVPKNRATLRWLSKRKVRGGITTAWREKQKGRSDLSIIISSCLNIVNNLFSAIAMLLRGKRRKRNRRWLRICGSFGVISGVLGLKVDSYKNIDGG